jgi:hypothetical protein
MPRSVPILAPSRACAPAASETRFSLQGAACCHGLQAPGPPMVSPPRSSHLLARRSLSNVLILVAAPLLPALYRAMEPGAMRHLAQGLALGGDASSAALLTACAAKPSRELTALCLARRLWHLSPHAMLLMWTDVELALGAMLLAGCLAVAACRACGWQVRAHPAAGPRRQRERAACVSPPSVQRRRRLLLCVAACAPRPPPVGTV